MTVAAMSWAFRQLVPPKPKVILLALADQADELTGKVCYGPTSLDHISEKSSIPRRTLTRYLGALVRNNYMRRESNKDRGQASHYWLCLDRERALSLEEWSFVSEAGDDERDDTDETQDAADPQHIEGVGQNGPPPPEPKTEKSAVQNGPPGGPPNGPGVGHMDGPHESTNYQRTKERARDEKKANGFSKEAQEEDRACVVAERVNKSANASVFVIDGTRAYEAWAAEMRRRTGLRSWHLTVWANFEGKQRSGWYFPSLFPPSNKPQAPPGGLSDADAQDLMGT